MKPAPFAYLAPTTLADAVALLEAYGDDAKLLAGGQSLMPLLNMRLARPKVLVDLGAISDLRYIRDQGSHLAIGALTRQREVECSPLVAQRCPLLCEALTQVAHPQIRNRGTIGGSVAHADPAAELGAVALVLDAEVVAAGAEGERIIPASAWFVTYFTTALLPGEVLKEVRFGALPPGTGWCFTEVARRQGDFALVGVAATVSLHRDGRTASAAVALTGVGGVPVRATATEQSLLEQEPTEAVLDAAAAHAADGLEPDGDIHASAGYRRQLARTLTRRALATALRRANGGDIR